MAIHHINVGNFEFFMLFWQFEGSTLSIVGNPTPGLKLTPAPLWLKVIFIGISMVEQNYLVNSGNSLYKCG